MVPSSASLRAVGLQWYQEDGNVPAKCYKPPYGDFGGGTSMPLWDKDCVQAITGKTDADTFTFQDWETVLDWGGKNVKFTNKADVNDFGKVSQKAAQLLAGRDGLVFTEYPTTGISYDPQGIVREGGELANDVVTKAGDLPGGLLSMFGLEAAVPVGVLVLGLGLVGFGVFRLIR